MVLPTPENFCADSSATKKIQDKKIQNICIDAIRENYDNPVVLNACTINKDFNMACTIAKKSVEIKKDIIPENFCNDPQAINLPSKTQKVCVKAIRENFGSENIRNLCDGRPGSFARTCDVSSDGLFPSTARAPPAPAPVRAPPAPAPVRAPPAPAPVRAPPAPAPVSATAPVKRYPDITNINKEERDRIIDYKCNDLKFPIQNKNVINTCKNAITAKQGDKDVFDACFNDNNFQQACNLSKRKINIEKGKYFDPNIYARAPTSVPVPTAPVRAPVSAPAPATRILKVGRKSEKSNISEYNSNLKNFMDTLIPQLQSQVNEPIINSRCNAVENKSKPECIRLNDKKRLNSYLNSESGNTCYTENKVIEKDCDDFFTRVGLNINKSNLGFKIDVPVI